MSQYGMTTDQLLLFGLLLAVFVFLIWGRWRYDLVAFAALMAAVVLGVVPVDQAFSGFGHPATIIGTGERDIIIIEIGQPYRGTIENKSFAVVAECKVSSTVVEPDCAYAGRNIRSIGDKCIIVTIIIQIRKICVKTPTAAQILAAVDKFAGECICIISCDNAYP